jgi:hypothetical protein
MMDLVFDPVIPPWLIAVLTLLGLGLIIASLGRCGLPPRERWILTAVRTLSLLVLAFLLLQPADRRVRQHTEAPTLAVLVDVSASMGDSPNTEALSRQLAVADLLKGPGMTSAARRFRLQWYEFGADLSEIPKADEHTFTFNAPRSQMVPALNELARRLRGQNVAGVLLLSDGLDQSGATVLPEALRLPVFIPELEVTEERPVEDRRSDTAIAELNAPKMLVLNWKGQVDVLLRRSTDEGRLVVPVQLYRDRERLRQVYASFEPGQNVRQVSLGLEPDQVGRFTYRVSIEPPDDTDPGNNQRSFVLEVTDPRNRLLYLEGAPRWDFKFLKRALMRDQNFEVSALVQGGPGIFISFSENGDSSTTSALPELGDGETIRYRCIILGEMKALALTKAQQEALVRYVEKGGGLLFLGSRHAYGPEGWPSGPLGQLLPFTAGPEARLTDGRYPLQATTMGRSHAIMEGLGQDLVFPELLSLWSPVQPRPGAVPVLATTTGAPILLTNNYGQGKVAALLSDSMWRWQMGGTQMEDGKALYDRFLLQLVHWLAPSEKPVTEKATLQVLTAGAEAEIRAVVPIGAIMGEQTAAAAQQLTATITCPDERVLSFSMPAAHLGEELGLPQPLWGWRCEFSPHVAGEYQISVKAPTGEEAHTRLLVLEPQLERTGQALNRTGLQDIAKRTGGQWLPYAERERWSDRVPYQPVELKQTEQLPLWNRAWLLVLLLALFCAEWYFRARLNLV